MIWFDILFVAILLYGYALEITSDRKDMLCKCMITNVSLYAVEFQLCSDDDFKLSQCKLDGLSSLTHVFLLFTFHYVCILQYHIVRTQANAYNKRNLPICAVFGFSIFPLYVL